MALNQCLWIKSSVGERPGAMNTRADVEAIQKLLNEKASKVGYQPFVVNGQYTPRIAEAIRMFQQKVLKMHRGDGTVDPNGVTLRTLNEPEGAPAPIFTVRFAGVYSHPDAEKVVLTYGVQGDGKGVVKMNPKAEYLLKSIVASCGFTGAQLNSTLRTYHDQARITLTQTIKKADGASTVATWYGQPVADACKKYENDISGMAKWWQEYDKNRGKVSSKHLSNRALDVVPSGDRARFAARVQELVPLANTGVKRIIPKGVMNEPVDHVEFTFDVTG